MKPDSPTFEDDDSPSLPGAARELVDTEQLSQEVEQLEAQKDQLQTDIDALKREYEKLDAAMQQRLIVLEGSKLPSVEATKIEASRPAASYVPAKLSAGEDDSSAVAGTTVPDTVAGTVEVSDAVAVTEPSDLSDSYLSDSSNPLRAAQPQSSLLIPMPRLPGERQLPKTFVSRVRAKSGLKSAAERGPVELPMPSTSEQRRARYLQRRAQEKFDEDRAAVMPRRGVILSAIAAGLMAWHFCVVGALEQGGSWLGLPIAQLGTGFVPAVALLWLRMLVMVPALVFLAPQLYRYTWEDLQDWIQSKDWLLAGLIGSGVALFLSQVLIYQCIGLLGPVMGAMLLFLYPLTAVPLGAVVTSERRPSPLGLLALVAIAMGGILAIRPVLNRLTAGGVLSETVSGAVGDAVATNSITTSPIMLGLVASLAFSVYIVLTNLSYRQQHCHPMPVSIVQFSTVAVLSSVVLLLRPLSPVAISWLSFSLWGILLGLVMLLVYLFSYSSLRLIGSRTAIVAAATPVATLLLAWGFTPRPSLVILQWTGILLVTIGGIAFGQEKLNNFKP